MAYEVAAPILNATVVHTKGLRDIPQPELFRRLRASVASAAGERTEPMQSLCLVLPEPKLCRCVAVGRMLGRCRAGARNALRRSDGWRRRGRH